MKLKIVHETAYQYVPAVRTAVHIAHLKPIETRLQRLISHRLEIHPSPVRQSLSVDRFGNTRTYFNVPSAHASLRVTAHSVVETFGRPALPPSISWEHVRERMRYHRDTFYDPAVEFVFASPYVPRDQSFANYAESAFAPGRPLLEAAHDLMERIHGDFIYEPQATTAHTPALEALRIRKGVCQDLAHVMVGCLRSLGLPARYVSGYLLTHPPSGQPRLTGADASHAWVSVYVPHDFGGIGSWVDFDPTNARLAGDDYVTLAIGRDYSDVSPIRGVIHGGSNHTLAVAVTVTPLDHTEQ